MPHYWHNVTQHVEIPGSGGKVRKTPLALLVLLIRFLFLAGSNNRQLCDSLVHIAQVVEIETLLYDSCIMAGNADIYNEDGSLSHELPLSQLPGPPDPELASEQLQWLEDMMSSSTADYLCEKLTACVVFIVSALKFRMVTRGRWTLSCVGHWQ